MIEWGKIKAALQPLVAELAKLDVSQVRWREESESTTWTRDPVVYLSIRDVQQSGIEEERREFPDNADAQTVNVCAQKQFTLGVRAESFTQDVSDPRHAGSLLENIKIRLGRSSTTERLRALVALSDYTSTVKIDYSDDDGRLVCAYNFDLFCLVADNDLDDSDGSGDVIEEVLVDGIVNTVAASNPSGNAQLPVSLDVNAS